MNEKEAGIYVDGMYFGRNQELKRIRKKLEEFIVFMESSEYSGRQINSFEKHFAEYLSDDKHKRLKEGD